MKAKILWKFLYVLAFLTLPGVATSAPLTEEQYTLLRLDIQHDPSLADEVSAADYGAIANAYNLDASPVCWVWRTKVPEQEVYEKTSDIPSTWDWDIYAGLQPGTRDSWVRMHAFGGAVNASLPTNRTALDKFFKGADATQKTHILAIWRRKALRGERLYASTPGGACATTNPATMTWEGKITYGDVNRALTGAPLP